MIRKVVDRELPTHYVDEFGLWCRNDSEKRLDAEHLAAYSILWTEVIARIRAFRLRARYSSFPDAKHIVADDGPPPNCMIHNVQYDKSPTAAWKLLDW